MERARRDHVRILLMAAIAAVTLMAAGVASAEWLLPEQRLTTNTASQRWPEVYGTRVVYEDHRNEHDVGDPDDPTQLYDIRVLDFVKGTDKLLTPYHTAVGSSAISGNYVIWEDYGHGSVQGGIYYHNLSTGTTKRLPISSGRELEISGSRVTYEAYRGGHWRIYVFDLKTNVEKRITTDDATPGAPDISGTKIVWQDFRDGNHEIYCYDLATGVEKRITNNPASQTLPKISGDRIVWMDERNGIINDDIYTYDLSTNTETQVTTDSTRQIFPSVSNDIIVWMDERNGDTDIYMRDMATGVETRVTSNPFYQGYPRIAGDRIVYEDVRSGDSDLYLTRIAYPEITAGAPYKISYGSTARVTGTVKTASGVPLAGKTVRVEVSRDKKDWTMGETTTTTASGYYTLYTQRMGVNRYVRVRFSGDADAPAGVSNMDKVWVRAYFWSAPRLKSTSLREDRTYKVWGYFKPKHRSGSMQMKVRAYRKLKQSDGTYRYVYKKTFRTKVYNTAGSTYAKNGYSKYIGYIRLPSTGTWRLRSVHSADSNNADSYSRYRYVRVR